MICAASSARKESRTGLPCKRQNRTRISLRPVRRPWLWCSHANGVVVVGGWWLRRPLPVLGSPQRPRCSGGSFRPRPRRPCWLNLLRRPCSSPHSPPQPGRPWAFSPRLPSVIPSTQDRFMNPGPGTNGRHPRRRTVSCSSWRRSMAIGCRCSHSWCRRPKVAGSTSTPPSAARRSWPLTAKAVRSRKARSQTCSSPLPERTAPRERPAVPSKVWWRYGPQRTQPPPLAIPPPGAPLPRCLGSRRRD